MKLQTHLAALSLVLTLPGVAMAQAFPCVYGTQCEYPSTSKVLPQADVKDPLMGKYYGVSSFLRDEDLKGIKLTVEQHAAITKIIEDQLPDVFNQIKSLEDAHALLRDMALSKQYDDGLATVLTKTIAESSARLALLQAQREYQVYEILTPEQARGLKITKSGT
ncbi:MAG TPA: hypothetical protein VGC12_00490 [Methyloradius sp.]